MVKCLNCQKETHNVKFCSRSCAATITNINTRRHKPNTRICKKCSIKFLYVKNTTHYRYCHDCYQNVLSIKEQNVQRLLALKMKDFRYKRARYGGPPSLAMTMVRGYARIWNSHMLKSCQVCGYDKHVELAHVKPLAKFDDETLITEVNAEENMRGLCPNHHWEFDKGLIPIENIPILKRNYNIEELIRSYLPLTGTLLKYGTDGLSGL